MELPLSFVHKNKRKFWLPPKFALVRMENLLKDFSLRAFEEVFALAKPGKKADDEEK